MTETTDHLITTHNPIPQISDVFWKKKFCQIRHSTDNQWGQFLQHTARHNETRYHTGSPSSTKATCTYWL